MKLYGQVNRGILYADDGNTQEIFHVDNDHSSTRIGFLGDVQVNDKASIGAKIEVQFESNSSSNVNQGRNVANENDTNAFTRRFMELWFDDAVYGKFSFGHGSTASDGGSSVDLSGTTIVGTSSIADMAGGLSFATASTGAIAGNPTIGAVFSDLDGLGRDDRLRYDTSSLGGLTFSTSAIDGGEYDMAAAWSRKFPNFDVGAKLAYSNPSATSATISNTFNGSISILLRSGLNFTYAAGKRDMSVVGRNNPFIHYGKLGYIANLTPLGSTALAFDFGRSDDIAQNNDEATVFGVLAVQSFKDWGTEIYGGYRVYQLSRPGSSFDDISAALAGARVKF